MNILSFLNKENEKCDDNKGVVMDMQNNEKFELDCVLSVPELSYKSSRKLVSSSSAKNSYN